MSDVKKYQKDKLEIERKFLVAFPEIKLLEKIPKTNKSKITQIYLLSEKGSTCRVRKRVYADETKYYFTEKRRITAASCFEDEREISEAEYISALKMADPSCNPVSKTRYIIFSPTHLFELDIFPFWSDRAIMEVELSSEAEEFEFPCGIVILKEVTSDKRYKNIALAKRIPYDEVNK